MATGKPAPSRKSQPSISQRIAGWISGAAQRMTPSGWAMKTAATAVSRGLGRKGKKRKSPRSGSTRSAGR